jgi:membrane associated rhomboid family serine protease
MDDRFTKYSKLYFLVFLLFLAVPVSFALLIATFYGFSTLISSRPVDIIFELIVIGIPSAVFATAYYIFFKRTKKHPSPSVKIISQILFVIGFLGSLFFLVLSIISYFKKGYNNITDYATFHIAFLAGNIGGLFLIAIMQAFTTKKEEDWMTKRNKMSR